MQSDILPEPIKSTLQSATSMAQEAFTTSLGGVAHTFHHDHQKEEAHSSHRNANPEDVHTRNPNAPKDLGEFMQGQLEGKIDDAKLAEQFPTRGGMWHGFIDVSTTPLASLMIC
jgi:hypothetical protein